MATDRTKKRIGTMPCEGARCKSHNHGVPVVVFQNEKGTLSYRCDYCDRSPYAREGTDQHGEWMEDIKPMAGAVEVVPPSLPQIAVPPVVKRKAFDMGAL